MGQDQFRSITKTSIFRKTKGSNAGDTSHDKGDETEEQTDRRKGADKLRWSKDKKGLLTKFVSMFRTDSGHNSVRERGGPLWLRLVDELRNANPALALARRLRRVLREALQQADGGSLEVLHDVGCGWRVCVRRWMDNVKAGERECVGVGGMRRWVAAVGKADAGRAGEREDVRLVRVRTWADEARDAGGDAPPVQRRRAFVLEERDGGEDGVGRGRVEEADERVGLFVGDGEGDSRTWEENEWIW